MSMDTITTGTHTIEACYTINGEPNEMRVDISGHTLSEIVDDQLQFWNSRQFLDVPFEIVLDDAGQSRECLSIILEGAVKGRNVDVVITADINN